MSLYEEEYIATINDGDSPFVTTDGNIQEEPITVLEEGKGNIFSSTLTSVQTSVGAGMLAIPYAFKSMGLIPALSLVVLVAAFSFYTLWMILKAADHLKLYNLKKIGEKLYGKFMGPVFEFGVFFICFGGASVYLILIGQALPPVFAAWFGQKALLANRIFVVGLLMVVVLVPLCASRELSFLSYFSSISVFSACYVLIVVVVKFITTISGENYSYANVYLFPQDYAQAFGAFPILFLSFGAHVTVLPLFNDLKGRSLPKMTLSVFTNVVVVVAIYIGLGTCGFFVFQEKTTDNVLVNFLPDEIMATIAKFGVGIQLTISFAFLHYVTRESIESVIFSKFEFDWYRWLLLEGMLLCAFFLIFSLFEEIVTIFSLTGAIFGVLVFYVFPILFYLKIETSWLKRIPAIIVLIATVLSGVAGFVAVFLGILKDKFGVQIDI